VDREDLDRLDAVLQSLRAHFPEVERELALDPVVGMAANVAAGRCLRAWA
jgi:hypothetical protein